MEQLARETSTLNFIFWLLHKNGEELENFNTSKKAACNIKWQFVYYSWHSNTQRLSHFELYYTFQWAPVYYCTAAAASIIAPFLRLQPPKQKPRNCNVLIGKWRFSNLTNHLYISYSAVLIRFPLIYLISRSHYATWQYMWFIDLRNESAISS